MSNTKSTITDKFRTKTETVRGTTYSFRELTAREYDDIIKLASGDDDNADLATVLRMMTLKSITPTIPADDLMELPYPVYSKLLGIVNKMHFGVEDDEKETPPNESEPTSSSTSS